MNYIAFSALCRPHSFPDPEPIKEWAWYAGVHMAYFLHNTGYASHHAYF